MERRAPLQAPASGNDRTHSWRSIGAALHQLIDPLQLQTVWVQQPHPDAMVPTSGGSMQTGPCRATDSEHHRHARHARTAGGGVAGSRAAGGGGARASASATPWNIARRASSPGASSSCTSGARPSTLSACAPLHPSLLRAEHWGSCACSDARTKGCLARQCWSQGKRPQALQSTRCALPDGLGKRASSSTSAASVSAVASSSSGRSAGRSRSSIQSAARSAGGACSHQAGRCGRYSTAGAAPRASRTSRTSASSGDLRARARALKSTLTLPYSGTGWRNCGLARRSPALRPRAQGERRQRVRARKHSASPAPGRRGRAWRWRLRAARAGRSRAPAAPPAHAAARAPGGPAPRRRARPAAAPAGHMPAGPRPRRRPRLARRARASAALARPALRARRRGEHTLPARRSRWRNPWQASWQGECDLCVTPYWRSQLCCRRQTPPQGGFCSSETAAVRNAGDPAVGVGAPASAERADALLTRARAAQGAPSPSASLSASPLAPRCTPAPPGAGDAQAAAPSPDAARHAATGGNAAARCASTICSSGSSAGATSAGRRLRARRARTLRWSHPARAPLRACLIRMPTRQARPVGAAAAL